MPLLELEREAQEEPTQNTVDVRDLTGPMSGDELTDNLNESFSRIAI